MSETPDPAAQSAASNDVTATTAPTRIVRVEATATTIHEADLEELKRLYPQHWQSTDGDEHAFVRLCWLREVDGPWDELGPDAMEPEILFRDEPGPDGFAIGESASL